MMEWLKKLFAKHDQALWPAGVDPKVKADALKTLAAEKGLIAKEKAAAKVIDPGEKIVKQILADLNAGGATIIPLEIIKIMPCKCAYCQAVKTGNQG